MLLSPKIAVGLASLAMLGLATASQAAPLQPVSVTGYNQDVIANGGTNNASTTTNSLDTGATNVVNSTTTSLDGNYVYFAAGFISNNATVGLPAGSTFTSAANTTGTFASTVFAIKNATGNNALLLTNAGNPTPGGVPSSGTLALTSPGAYTSLAFLVTGLNASTPGTYSLTFATGSPTTAIFTANDNFNGTPYAIQNFGRVSRGDGGLQGAGYPNGVNPRLYEVDVTLSATDATRTLTGITFTDTDTGTGTGTGAHNFAVFGVSGIAVAPEPSQSAAFGLGVLGLAGMALKARRRLA